MRNDFSHVLSNFAENLMSKHEYGDDSAVSVPSVAV